jgi:hypothetical protein
MNTEMLDMTQKLVLSSCKMNNIPEDKIPFLMCDFPQFTPKNFFPVELKKSKIHGNGLFVTRKVPKGEVLTMYPCHMMAFKPKNGNPVKLFFKNYEQKNFTMDYAQMLKSTHDDNVYVVGDPTIPFVRSTSAHFINDPYPYTQNLKTLSKDANLETLGKAYIDYELRVQSMANSAIYHTDTYAYAKAIKNIEEGEEILAPYDFDYWYVGNTMSTLPKVMQYMERLPQNQNKYMKKVFFARALQ